ncbi:MAG: DUF5329 family protein, partial [Syntrophorhabdales bacterium]
TVVAVLILYGLVTAAQAVAISPEEQRKIEALITHVGGMTDARFIRNGKSYGPKTAAWFLRRKWEANREKVRTSREFIAEVATRSSTTGIPYMIRFKDGKEVPCADYLMKLLERDEPPAR